MTSGNARGTSEDRAWAVAMLPSWITSKTTADTSARVDRKPDGHQPVIPKQEPRVALTQEPA